MEALLPLCFHKIFTDRLLQPFPIHYPPACQKQKSKCATKLPAKKRNQNVLLNSKVEIKITKLRAKKRNQNLSLNCLSKAETKITKLPAKKRNQNIQLNCLPKREIKICY